MQVTMTMEEYTKLITANAKQVVLLNKTVVLSGCKIN